MDLIVAQMTTPRELLLLLLLLLVFVFVFVLLFVFVFVLLFVLDVLVTPEPLGISGGRCKSE